MLPAMRRTGIAVALAMFALGSTNAHAANAERMRTPALFEGAPCMTVVDKSVDGPVFHIEYQVPFDDVELTDDELDNSRRMQFFGFKEQRHNWRASMPIWINQADYDQANANGDIMMPYTDDDILEKSTQWSADAWVRITPDDPRLPITMEQAAMGVDWDLTDVAVGTWIVQVYTWEPEQNLWSFRLGAVRVEDSMATEESPGPSIFLDNLANTSAMVDEKYTFEGCVVADEGTTYSASWGVIEGLMEPNWIEFVDDAPLDPGNTLTIDWWGDERAAGSEVRIRVELEDSQGNVYTAFTPAPITVSCPGGCPEETDGGAETGDETDTSDDSVGDTWGDEGPSSNSDSNDADGIGGGGFCRTGGNAPPAAALLLLVLGVFRRRR